jgi:hypothetical protein
MAYVSVKTKAALKRLPIGTKMELIHSLFGPCEPQPRAIKRIQSNAIVFDLIKDGECKESYLYLDYKLVPTENGFKLVGPEVPHDPKRVYTIEYLVHNNQ